MSTLHPKFNWAVLALLCPSLLFIMFNTSIHRCMKSIWLPFSPLTISVELEITSCQIQLKVLIVEYKISLICAVPICVEQSFFTFMLYDVKICIRKLKRRQGQAWLLMKIWNLFKTLAAFMCASDDQMITLIISIHWRQPLPCFHYMLSLNFLRLF